MSDLQSADYWLSYVFNPRKPEEYRKQFARFSLMANSFILKEIQERMIPEAQKRGFTEYALQLKEAEEALEEIIRQK